jgi:hypothetical protein
MVVTMAVPTVGPMAVPTAELTVAQRADQWDYRKAVPTVG